MNAHSYWNQAQGEIPDGKTSSLSTWDVSKHCITDKFKFKIVLSKKIQIDKMDAMEDLLIFV